MIAGPFIYPNPLEYLRHEQERIAASCIHMEPHQWSPEEHIAVCFCAGVPMTLEVVDGEPHLSTAYKVGFRRMGAGVHIYVDMPEAAPETGLIVKP